MATFPPVIITSKDPMVYPEPMVGQPPPPPETPEQKRRSIERIIQEICDVRTAGAAISHHHGVPASPGTPASNIDQPNIDIDASAETILAARRKTDVIIQLGGVFGAPATSEAGQQFLEQAWKKAPWEMVSLHSNQMGFVTMGITRVTNREQMERALRFYRGHGVQPEYETWSLGGTWNLRHVLPRSGFNPPWWIELLHGAEGPAWSPAIPEVTFQRASFLPEGCQWHATAYSAPRGLLTPEEHTQFLTQIMARGGHVGIGIEDRANLATGQPAKSNAELVELIAWIARRLGREVATPDQARQMLGIKPV